MNPPFDSIDWGYCGPCNRLIPVDGEGNLTAHRGYTGSVDDRGLCAGSLEAPMEPPEEPAAWDDTESPPPSVPPPRRPPGCRDPFGLPYSYITPPSGKAKRRRGK